MVRAFGGGATSSSSLPARAICGSLRCLALPWSLELPESLVVGSRAYGRGGGALSFFSGLKLEPAKRAEPAAGLGGWQPDADGRGASSLLRLSPAPESPMMGAGVGGDALSCSRRHELRGLPVVSGLPWLPRLPEGSVMGLHGCYG